ncbi:MAG: PH domain-containing protein [Methylococcales bacterium]
MNEDIIWTDKPSQTLNLGNWFSTLIICLVVFYGFPMTYNYLSILIVPYLDYLRYGVVIVLVARLIISIASVFVRKYELTSTELEESYGILNQKFHSLELYRIKDISVDIPFFLRFFNQGTLVLHTSDHSTPVIYLEGIDEPRKLKPILRDLVNTERRRNGVREID